MSILTQQEALQALLRGEELEFRRQGWTRLTNTNLILDDTLEFRRQGWTRLTNTNLILDDTLEFRIAPRVTMANGIEIPLGYRGKMSMGQSYFLPALHARSCYDSASWDGGDYDTIMMKRGLVFLTKEDAVACAKAIISLGRGDL